MKTFNKDSSTTGSVSDPGPDWIRIRNENPDPGSQKLSSKKGKIKKFHCKFEEFSVGL
jgi:hypothetical protein